MKLLITLLLLLGIGACQFAENKYQATDAVRTSDSIPKMTSLSPQDKPLTIIPSSEQDSSQLLLPKNSTEKPQTAVDLSTIKAAIRIASQTIEAIDEQEKRYIAEVPFSSFCGQKIGWGELEITAHEKWTIVHADYFAETPVGAKRFFARNDSLLCTEIIQLKEIVTENGLKIVETISYQFYYYNGQLIEALDFSKKNTLDSNRIAWRDENLKDWETIQVHINE